MIRTEKQIDGIRSAIEKLDKDAQEKVWEVVNRVGVDDYMALRDALMAEVMPVMEMASQLAAELSASVYNSWRYIDIGETIETLPFATYTPDKGEAVVNTATKYAKEGREPHHIVSAIMSRIEYDTVGSYSLTMLKNAARDPKKPKYARVPANSEACDFCMMLASRGFAYATGKSGEKVHNHNGCKCVYVCSWDKDARAQGYDEDEWYDRWQEAVDAEARERAEKNPDTTINEQREQIMQRYERAAAKARKR